MSGLSRWFNFMHCRKIRHIGLELDNGFIEIACKYKYGRPLGAGDHNDTNKKNCKRCLSMIPALVNEGWRKP